MRSLPLCRHPLAYGDPEISRLLKLPKGVQFKNRNQFYMIKHLFSPLFFLSGMLSFFIFWPAHSHADQRIMAIQSVRIAPYEKAVKGFESICFNRIDKYVLSELKGTDIVKTISKNRPDMVLAVGLGALSKVKTITDIPVVYLMVSAPQTILSGNRNISGVSMNVTREKQLSALLKIAPAVHTIGLLYDPEKTGHFVKKAQKAADKIGIRLLAKKTDDSKDVPGIIRKMKRGIDLFWMLPDTTVVTPETVRFMLLFFLENNTPIMTFSEKYLKLGAFISVGTDAYDMGAQAGEMANLILSGKKLPNGRHIHARKIKIEINRKIAKKLSIQIDENTIRDIGIND